MKRLIQKYRTLTYERKIIINTMIGLSFSSLFAVGKLLIGIFTDRALCVVAVYTIAMLLAKAQCVLGAKNPNDYGNRNILVSVFLFFSSVVYLGFMGRLMFLERKIGQYHIGYVTILALISFLELGFAIAGIIRTRNRGRFYRNIKIINFCTASIALLTTQMTILDFTTTENTDFFNGLTGICVGLLIALCAIYILFAPKISVVDRKRQLFVLREGETGFPEGERLNIPLLKSTVYGSYSYRAEIRDGRAEGELCRGPSIWHEMRLPLKILCYILSEILIFPWLFGRLVYFFRTIGIFRKLEEKMRVYGYQKTEESASN